MRNENYHLKSLEKLIKDIIENKQLEIKDRNAILEELGSIKKYLEEIVDFKEIVDKLYDGIYIADGDGNTLYVNQAYLNMTGLSKDDVVGKNVANLLKNQVYYNAVTLEVIKEKKTISSIGKARKGKDMLITGTPILSEDGTVRQVVVIDRDISQLKAMEKELEISKEKMRIVENITRKKNEELKLLRKQQLNNNFIGSSKEMQEVSQLIAKVAPLDVTVLITGESGVGKEVVANQILLNSSRKNKPYIKVNCAAIPANLIEAELFGYEKGAFTDAKTSKSGLFELAEQGTLLLDEIGEMPFVLQAKLLRAIQNKQITRIGGTKPIDLDVRIIAATNANLKELVSEGKFREDLYYRLNVFPIHIPPLHSRPTDIKDLVDYFLKIYNTKYNKEIIIEEDGILMLQQYPWPGNIRELQNIIERIVVISDTYALIDSEKVANILMIDTKETKPMQYELGLKEAINNIERDLIKKALKETGSTRKAAKILKISQSAVVKKSKKLHINLNDYK